MIIDLPEPVSPVSKLRPLVNPIFKSSIMAKF